MTQQEYIFITKRLLNISRHIRLQKDFDVILSELVLNLFEEVHELYQASSAGGES